MSSAQKLRQIAQVLGVPVEYFREVKGDSLISASAMLQVYASLGSDAARQKVIEFARALADQSGDTATSA